MTPTPETLDDIESKAKAATPGPYRKEMLELSPGGPMTLGVGSAELPVCIVSGIVESPRGQRDAAYLAALDPTTVLALVAECRELRRLRAELREWKKLASSIVEAEEADDVKFRDCAWSSEWSAEFLRLARGAKEGT